LLSGIKELVRYSIIAFWGILALPWAALSFIEKRVGRTESLYLLGAHAMSLIPGFVGKYARAAFYVMTLDYCHPTVIVSFGSFFATRKARVQFKAGVGEYCIIGLVDLGKRVRVASRVPIVSGLHEHGSTAKMGDLHSGGAVRRIEIGDEVWIGEGAVIGAAIGEHSIVGIGSVVVNDIPAWSFAMGNPARILPGSRKPQSPS